MPGKPVRYALNLYFDPGSTTGRFEDQHTWSRSENHGNSWDPPVLVTPQHPLKVMRNDEVQFTVASTAAHETVKAVEISVTFGRIESGSGTLVASPFEDQSGSPRCLLNDPAQSFEGDNFHAHFIGPYTVGNLKKEKAGTGTLKFEFVVVARVTFTNGGVDTVKDYGYDPEMDVEVGI